MDRILREGLPTAAKNLCKLVHLLDDGLRSPLGAYIPWSTNRIMRLTLHRTDLTESTHCRFLGLTISDGNFGSSKKTVLSSERMSVKISEKYDWSETAGNAYCHVLNELGFRTNKGKDVYSSFSDIPLHVWKSESSPFFVCVRQELFNLRGTRNKNNNGVRPDWVLDAPRSWRIAML